MRRVTTDNEGSTAYEENTLLAAWRVRRLVEVGGDDAEERIWGSPEALDNNRSHDDKRATQVGALINRPWTGKVAKRRAAELMMQALRDDPRQALASLPARFYASAILEARDIWDGLLENYPTDSAILMHSALFYSSWHPSHAIEILDRWEGASGASDAIRLCRAAVHHDLKFLLREQIGDAELRLALGHLQGVVSRNETQAPDCQLLAVALEDSIDVHLRLHELAEARVYAEQLTELCTGAPSLRLRLASAKYLMGMIHLWSGDLSQAEDCLMSAMRASASGDPLPEGRFWALPDGLISHGMSKTVLKAVDVCSDVWPQEQKRFTEWQTAIVEGKAPKAWDEAREHLFPKSQGGRGKTLGVGDKVAEGLALALAIPVGVCWLAGSLMWKLLHSRRARLKSRATQALQAGNPPLAMSIAQELLAIVNEASHSRANDRWRYAGHLLLGRAALAGGDPEAAGSELLRAAAHWSPSTGDHHPETPLFRELLAVGHTQPVMDFLAVCSQRSIFRRPFCGWITAIEEGEDLPMWPAPLGIEKT